MNAHGETQFTFLACADVKGIWDAIAMPTDPWGLTVSDKLAAAQAFAKGFAQHCELLGNSPEIGLQRDDLNDGLRSSAFGKYVIFYRVHGRNVEIMRVLRAVWDVTSRA